MSWVLEGRNMSSYERLTLHNLKVLTIPFFYYRETGRLIPGEKSPILIPPDVRYQFFGKFLSLVGLIPTKKNDEIDTTRR